MFREYISLLTAENKKYLILGNMNAFSFSEVFPLLKANKLWTGCNRIRNFRLPDGDMVNLSSVVWFTNLKDTSVDRKMSLTEKYSPERYRFFDNYNAINIDVTKNIPDNYFGDMGVPLSFITKYNSGQFELLGVTGERTAAVKAKPTKEYFGEIEHRIDGNTLKSNKLNRSTVISLKDKPHGRIYYTADNAEGYLICLYARVLIRRKEV